MDTSLLRDELTVLETETFEVQDLIQTDGDMAADSCTSCTSSTSSTSSTSCSTSCSIGSCLSSSSS